MAVIRGSRIQGTTVRSVQLAYTVEYLVVAGGGAGGQGAPSQGQAAGGGGAGGYRLGNLQAAIGTSYSITVGSGGATPQGSGTPSSAFGIESAGGGAGIAGREDRHHPLERRHRDFRGQCAAACHSQPRRHR